MKEVDKAGRARFEKPLAVIPRGLGFILQAKGAMAGVEAVGTWPDAHQPEPSCCGGRRGGWSAGGQGRRQGGPWGGLCYGPRE